MKKVLIITYYWPPSGGSGVQRWMYFAKYLSEFGYEPIILTVEPKYASYKFIDKSFVNKTEGIQVYRTKSSEPFNLYSSFIGKSKEEAIPQAFAGESNPGLLQKLGRFVRGNFFIPDARIGWVRYAYNKAVELLSNNDIQFVITSGPPHSTHLVGLKLKKKFGVKWIADFRDPWTEVFYNKLFYRLNYAKVKDEKLEKAVLENASTILTIGPSMAELLLKKITNNAPTKNVEFVYNGYDQEVFKKLNSKIGNNKFVICHLGVLSDNQPIDSFVIAMKGLIEVGLIKQEKVKILLIGRIAPNIIDLIKKTLPSIELEVKNYMTHNEAMQEIVNADLLFNSLANVADGKYLISGKLVEYIATGNPILCLGDSDGDGQKLLNEFENAKVFDRNDLNGIIEFIKNRFIEWEAGNNGNGINLEGKYSRRNMTGKLSEILSKIN